MSQKKSEKQGTYSEFNPHYGDRVSPTFCVLPWLHRFTNIGGEVQVCCVAEEYDSDVIDERGFKINLDRIQDDEAIMNSQFMKDLRLKMLKGEWPSYCRRCQTTEAGGGHSRRQFENAIHANFISRVVNDTRADGAIRVKLRSMDFRLGNLCNLACRMCNPRSSSKWIKDWTKVDQDWFRETDEELQRFRRLHYYENPKVWESFKKQIPYLRHLHFAGGEPLIVPQMVDALKMCIDSGHASDICLTYNTNVTRLPDEVKELWPKFRYVRVYASIDAYGKLNEYIRHPSRWDEIHRNLKDLEANFDKYGLRQVLVMTTVQAYNVTQVDQLFEYLRNNFERVIPTPHLINLHHPFHYLTQILPPALKNLAKERLLQQKEISRQHMEAKPRLRQSLFYLEAINEIIAFMEAEDRQDLLPQFLRAATSKDRFRGEDLFSVLPEFEVLRSVMSPRLAADSPAPTATAEL